jgi:hypothetical protein
LVSALKKRSLIIGPCVLVCSAGAFQLLGRGYEHQAMTRRESIRSSVLFAIGMALGKLDSLKAGGGQLTCDLNQWETIVFKYRGRVVTIPVSEVFSTLQRYT